MIIVNMTGITLAQTLVDQIAEKWDNFGAGQFIATREEFADAALRYLYTVKEQVKDTEAIEHIAYSYRHQRTDESIRGYHSLEAAKKHGFIQRYTVFEALNDIQKTNYKQAS